MSENHTDESAPAAKPGKKAPRKAAKKAARKTAKKAAVKSAKRVSKPAGESEQAVLPFDAPASKPQKKSAGTRTSRPENGGSKEPGEATARQDLEARAEKPVRFGRVPGGGPVQRDEQESSSAPEKRDQSEGRERGRDDHRSRDRGRDDQRQRGQNQERGERGEGGRRRKRRRKGRRDRDQRQDGADQDDQREAPVVLEGPKVEADGLLELAPKGFGFLRVPDKNFEQSQDDVFVPPDLVRQHSLRVGQWINGRAQKGNRGYQLVDITTVNGVPPEEAKRHPAFEELTAINPNKRIAFETEQERNTTRVLDLVSPVGRGQRGLIVSPPRSGKTTLLLHVAEAVRELHDETMHLMVLLVDERPEEVTEFRRQLPGVEVYASSNDEHPRNHTRIAELAIERAKRLVEGGTHVFLLMDSITRLARAYNGAMRGKGRGIGSGGVMVGALEAPRRLFAAARNTREAGSLTILATALIQTNSRADDAIFQEFKGTGNMELVLDRKIAENYTYPAVDIFKSGTRREELLLPEHTLHKIHMIRRGLAGHRPLEAMERLSYFLKKFPSNPQMLLEIKG